MVKQKASDVKKELKDEQDEFYGDTSISGSAPDPESDDKVLEFVKEVTGNEPKPGDPFSLAEEVEKDEKARRTKPDTSEEK